jgi:hypothetical protein
MSSSNIVPTDPMRVRAFAVFFKRYMSISTIVAAALPIPVTSLGLIPTFSQQTKLLSVYASLFCFLALGLIFYSRHQLARVMFPEYFNKLPKSWHSLARWLPLFFIIASISAVFIYDRLLDASIDLIEPYVGESTASSVILATTEFDDIPNSSFLILAYLMIFIMAEAAFIMMAIKEYLQDLVGLSEIELIKGPTELVKKIDDSSDS